MLDILYLSSIFFFISWASAVFCFCLMTLPSFSTKFGEDLVAVFVGVVKSYSIKCHKVCHDLITEQDLQKKNT